MTSAVLRVEAIALFVVGCGRSELLADDGVSGHDAGSTRGSPTATLDEDGASSPGRTQEQPPGQAPNADVGAGAPSSMEGGDFFTSNDGTGDDGGALASDGAGGAGGGKRDGCAPTNCTGCCDGQGACELGLSHAACGRQGEACHWCDVEKGCSPTGVCE